MVLRRAPRNPSSEKTKVASNEIRTDVRFESFYSASHKQGKKLSMFIPFRKRKLRLRSKIFFGTSNVV